MRHEMHEIYEIEACQMTAEHLSDVANLERSCFSEPWSEKSLALLTGTGGFGVVLLWNKQVVAYGGMTTVLDEGTVTNIAVHPEFRGRGLGRRVVRFLLSEAEERGVENVFLEVRESNQIARSLYCGEGFEMCGTRKNFYRFPTESAVQMVYRRSKEGMRRS